MQSTRLFSHHEAARFYDLLGAALDTQAFYETAALHDLPTSAIQGLTWRNAISAPIRGASEGSTAAEIAPHRANRTVARHGR